MTRKGKIIRFSTAALALAMSFGLATANLYADSDRDGNRGRGHGKERGEGHERGNGHDKDRHEQKVSSLSIVPVITSLQFVEGQLLASGIASGVVKGKPVFAPFTTAVTLVPVTGGGGGISILQQECPILGLQLAPIHLDLLGLVVDTSQICLSLTAFENGGLLGNLLCGVANGLNLGTPLGDLLGALPAVDLNNLLLGLTAIINGALGNILGAVVDAIIPAQAGTCSILNLSLGPLNLNLLGLEVALSNCANGALNVAVTGDRGGGLLGNLACGLLGNGGLLGGTLGDLLDQLLGLPAL